MRMMILGLIALVISGCESPDEKARKLVQRMVATPSAEPRQEGKRTLVEASNELKGLGAAALPAMIDGLGDDRRFVGMWLMEPIVATSDAAVLPLAAAMMDEDVDRRRWALLIIAGLAADDVDISAAIPAILECTNDADPEIRAHSMLAIGCSRDDRGLPQLIEALTDPDERVRIEAVKTLEGIATARDANAMLQKNPHPQPSPSVLDEIRPLLIAVLSDESARLRRVAADALGEYGPHAEAALKQLLEDDPDGEVRAAAMKSLACIRIDGAVDELTHGLADPSARVRFTAAEWLGMLANPDTLLLRRRRPPPLPKIEPFALVAAIPALTTATQDDDPGVRSAAIKALKMIQSLPGIRRISSDHIRLQAVYGLAA